MKEKKKIGIWDEEELREIRNLIQKARELDEKRDMGRVFLSRAVGAFYGPKRAIRLLEALIESDALVMEICDRILDDVMVVESSLNLSGEESLDELWNLASILSKLTGVRMEKISFNDAVFDRIYVLGRLSFLVYLLRRKKNDSAAAVLLPSLGKKKSPQRNPDCGDYGRVVGCSSCRFLPIEPCEHSKMCSYCEPIGNDAIGSNWEPMSAIERAERLAYLGEDFDYGDIFEETVVDSILSLMESYGGYLPPLTDAEFWSQGPEFDGE